MKSFVVLGLFAAAGCNQILGLEATVPIDAGQPPDAPLPIARLTWLVADTDAAGVPLPAPLLTPMDPAPTVQVGRIDGPLTATTYLPDGSFEIPTDFPGTPWRVVYEVPGAATPVEVQWTTSAERIPHVTEPFIGHLVRTPLPSLASAMAVTPTGTGVSFSSARVAFTGVWGDSPTTSAVGTTLTFNLNNVLPFTGPTGAPEPTRGDRAVVLNYLAVVEPSANANCQRASGGTLFELAPTAGTVAVAPAWFDRVTSTEPFATVTNTDFGRAVRAGTAFTKLVPETEVFTQGLAYGRSTALNVPLFARRRAPGDIRMPAMVALYECDVPPPRFSVSVQTVSINASPFIQYPGLGVAWFSMSRAIEGTALRLTYGYVGAVASASSTYTLDTPAALATPPYMLDTTDLAAADHVALLAGTGPLTLTFGMVPVQGNDDSVDTSDYYEIVLHRVTATSISPVRTFRVPGRSASIDRSLLTAGTEYVFELRSFAGAPQAQVADFTTYTVPQSQGVMYTRTFIAR